MSNNQGWFWTPERLQKLRLVLGDLAQHDSQGAYFGPLGLESQVSRLGEQHGLSIDARQARKGLSILTQLGVIAPGKPGSKPKNYRRGYFPDMPRITEADIQRLRLAKGVKSAMPPAR